jgi:predicted MFS family arabinose efflux permease
MVAVLAAAAFVIFAQIFMIAPVLPALAQAFSTTPGHIGLAIPLYLIPHGLLTLVWGPISDRFGRRRVIMGSLIAFVVLAALTTLAPNANAFLAMRMLTAFAASGVVPIALALVGDLIPYKQRGHALGWLFGGAAAVAALAAVPLFRSEQPKEQQG